MIGSSQEKRLSALSNQSHDSQGSSSTASATSQDERRGVNNTGVVPNNGHGQEEEELDEMEVEYTEVSCTIIYSLLNKVLVNEPILHRINLTLHLNQI